MRTKHISSTDATSDEAADKLLSEMLERLSDADTSNVVDRPNDVMPSDYVIPTDLTSIASSASSASSAMMGTKGKAISATGHRSTSPLLVITCFLVSALLVALAVIGHNIFQDAQNTSKVMEDRQFEGSTLAQERVLTPEEQRLLEATWAGASPDDPDAKYLPTPLIASRDGLMIHTPILPRDITEIEFHQASYDTSLRLTPLVTIVDAEAAANKVGTVHTPYESQPFGEEPLIAQAVSTWRLYSEGDEMTAVDTGAVAGTYVYAPVSGTVVKIREYSLFEQIDDYEIHIQSPEHPGLDIVVLHIDNLEIEVGDELIGGCTRIAKVRNIGDIIDNNLSNFTAEGDPGNHCHVQVNDATREDYKGLEGALDIFGGKGYVRAAPA